MGRQRHTRLACGLASAGVKFERFDFFKQDELGVWTAPNGDQVAWFKDPEGNLLSIAQTSTYTT